MKLCIDLCSGLGGFSQAFKESRDWEVITVDIERKFKPTIRADVNFLPIRPGLHPDVILASPDCRYFSLAYYQFPRKGIKKALELVGACLEAIAELEPRFWMMENPKGRLRWFIARPRNTIRLNSWGYKTAKPTDLWGNIPLGLIPGERETIPGTGWTRRRLWTKVAGSASAAQRAKMPYELSAAILEAVSS